MHVCFGEAPRTPTGKSWSDGEDLHWITASGPNRKKLKWWKRFALDHSIQSQCFMAYRWGNNGESDRLYFLGLQNQYRLWLQPWNKRHLFLGRKAMTNLDSILKSRDITLPKKVYTVTTMFFLVVMYICESWTIKKAECWRIDTFELWCLRRLKSPLDC